jgi:Flp pilus assembly pilin Flp
MVLGQGNTNCPLLNIYWKGDIMRLWKNLWDDESGAVATEYVILVGLIAIALISVIVVFRQQIHDLLLSFANKLGGSDGTDGAPSKGKTDTISDFGGSGTGK